MRKIKILIGIIVMFIAITIFQNKVEAKSYSIESMDIQATIEKDGSAKIKQTLTYKFNGSYNGIYITVPLAFEDSQYSEIKDNKIPEKNYTGTGVIVENVFLGTSKNPIQEFIKSGVAQNGQSGVYTTNIANNLYEIKAYMPSSNTTRTFEIDYTIQNLCVKHNDVGELYYNFIGGKWETQIKELNINVLLPNNTKDIKIWGHGPYNGESKIISNQNANFKVQNVKPGQYVAARVMFNNEENIPASTKTSGVDGTQMIMKQEKSIYENKEEKEAYTNKIIIFAVCLLIYWIILMLIFEKDKKFILPNISDEELFEKYNPMIAGCIQGSRTILARDIIAVILNLINKKNIKLEIQQNSNLFDSSTRKDNYLYYLSKNDELESKMDEIEKYVYNWLFDQSNTVILQDRLEKMPKEKEANKKFKELNSKVENELAKIGANRIKVPLLVRGFNIFLFVLSIVFAIKHIMFNGFDMYSNTASIFVASSMAILFFLPIAFGVITLVINLIIMVRHKINKAVQKITGQKVVTTTITLIVLFGIIMILTAIFAPEKYLIADEFLICIATILILTDNLMMKNDVMMIEDFSKLNSLKYKIETSTLMSTRDVEEIVLWEKYLAYSVSFGITKKIYSRIKGLEIDDDLFELINNKDFYKTFIYSDYYYFYRYSSLDRRFLDSYNHTSGVLISSMMDGSSGGGGSFSGGGGSSGGGGRRRSVAGGAF